MARLQCDTRRDTHIGFMREVGNKPFTESELAKAQDLISHFGRANRLWMDTRVLRTAATVGAQAARASAFALIALDARGKVAYGNAHAERLNVLHGPIPSNQVAERSRYPYHVIGRTELAARTRRPRAGRKAAFQAS